MARVKGFTLIEILIVIVIIAVLAALLLVGISKAFTGAKESASEAMVRAMTGALTSYHGVYGDYPPSSLDRFRAKLPNDTNNGIEACVACLSSKRNNGPFYRPPDEGLYCNFDNDKVDKNITQWYFGDNQLRELMDSFSNVIFYMHHVDFDKPKTNQTRYVIQKGEQPTEVKPVKSPSTNTWANTGRFQLMTPGPDGKFGTPDDIRGW